MDKHQTKNIILICLVISVVVVFFAFRKNSPPQGITTTPAPIPVVQASQLTIVSSPDGKMNLTMKEKKNEGLVTFTFILSDEVKGVKNEIFVKIVSSGTTFSIPANTFSPDNKYVFLKEENAGQANYFVLTTSGAEIVKDAQILDISSLFSAKYDNYKVTEMTGWGGMNLIVINTDKVEGGVGPSFWFEVPSKAIIQLSNRFD
jgi:hypothetical protein